MKKYTIYNINARSGDSYTLFDKFIEENVDFQVCDGYYKFTSWENPALFTLYPICCTIIEVEE